MKKFFSKIKQYVAVDGLLHFLVCYAIIITFALIDTAVFPIAGTMVAVFCAAFKEGYDITFKHQDKKATVHNVIFNVLGILIGIVVCLLLKA